MKTYIIDNGQSYSSNTIHFVTTGATTERVEELLKLMSVHRSHDYTIMAVTDGELEWREENSSQTLTDFANHYDWQWMDEDEAPLIQAIIDEDKYR